MTTTITELNERLTNLSLTIDEIIEKERDSWPDGMSFITVSPHEIPNWIGGKNLAFGIVAEQGSIEEKETMNQGIARCSKELRERLSSPVDRLDSVFLKSKPHGT